MYGLYNYGYSLGTTYDLTSMYGMGCGHYSYGGMYNGLCGGYYRTAHARYCW